MSTESPNLGASHMTEYQKGYMDALLDYGVKGVDIAKIMNIAPSTITRRKQRKFDDTEMPHEETRGKKPKLSIPEQRNICRLANSNPSVTGPMIKEALQLHHVSERTIRRVLVKRGNLKSHYAARKPFISPKNRLARLKWAKEHVDWTDEQWDNVFWSDESPFHYKCQGRKRVWRGKNMRLDPKCMQGTVKHIQKIMVWGCMNTRGVGSIHHIKGIMDSPYYVNMIKLRVPEAVNKYSLSRSYIFQQDNDPKHTSHATRDFFKEIKANVMTWPAQSPDLNPIENLWSRINQLSKTRNIKNDEECWKFFQEQWNKITPDMCKTLVRSMRHRCQLVIKRRGYSIPY